MNIDKVVKCVIEMGYRVTPTMVKRGRENSIAIAIGDRVTRPVICIKDIEKLVSLTNYSDEDVAKWIVEQYTKSLDENIDDTVVHEFETSKKYLRIGLRPVSTPDDVFSVPYLDMEIYVFIDFCDRVIYVTERLLKAWNANKDEVFIVAKENSKKTFRIFDMEQMLFRIIKDKDLVNGITCNGKYRIYAIRINDGKNGAGAMYFNDLLFDIADKINDDLLIIPYTIDEVILVPYSTMSIQEAQECFFSENELLVDEEDLLADHAYRFVRSEKRIIY